MISIARIRQQIQDILASEQSPLQKAKALLKIKREIRRIERVLWQENVEPEEAEREVRLEIYHMTLDLQKAADEAHEAAKQVLTRQPELVTAGR